MQCGLDTEYVLDKMQLYEVDSYLKGLEIKERSAWEQTRLIMYSMIQVNSKRKLKLQDIITFSWEKNSNNNTVKKEDIERLKKLAEQWQNKMS